MELEAGRCAFRELRAAKTTSRTPREVRSGDHGEDVVDAVGEVLVMSLER